MDPQELDSLIKAGNEAGVRRLVRLGTPLDCLMKNNSPLMRAVVGKRLSMVRALLDMGASVDFRNNEGMTALHYAATHGALREAEVLLDAGADLEARSTSGRTPLAMACRKGKLDAAEMLLEKGADPATRDNTGWTLLFQAARFGSLPVVRWLVEELDADPSPMINGRRAEKLAEDNKHEEVAEYLRNAAACVPNLPSTMKKQSSPKQLPVTKAKEDSKMLEPSNSLPESFTDRGGARGPAELNVRHTYCLIQPSRSVYDTTTDPPGIVLLLNYKKFSEDTYKEREGAEYDVMNVSNLFQQMGYKVELHEDLTWKDTVWVLDEFSTSERLRKVGCVIVVVSSHGGNSKSSFATSEGVDVSVDFVHGKFIKDQSKEVSQMAKLFFFQFCRGEVLPKHQPDSCSAPENIISFFSTSDGFVAYRNTRTGSIFLSTVCQVLAERAYKDCLDDLFREVQRRYKERGKGATPEKQDLGFMKKFYFNPRVRKC